MTLAGDADRERAIVLLRDATVEGRLTLDEFAERVERTELARTDTELETITADLPSTGAADLPSQHRAVALGIAFGPATGLEHIDALRDDPSLAAYHLLPSVRGDLLAKLGRADEARAEFERAATLTDNAREKALLLARSRALATRA